MTALVLLSVAAPVLTRYPPDQVHLGWVWAPPNPLFWLGTDGVGRDLWSRLLYGGRQSLLIGGAAAATATGFGSVWGMVAGYFGGRTDAILSRVTEFWLATPLLVWLLFLAGVFGGRLGVGPFAGLVALGLWPGVARAVRARTMTLRGQPFVEAERALGLSDAAILFRHLLPLLTGLVLALGANTLAEAVYVESALSFLGLGPPPPTPDWGTLLAQAAQAGIWQDPWALVWPGVAIAWAVGSANLLADGIRAGLELEGEGE